MARHTFESMACVTTPPPTIHRVEAVTDLVYFEASTAHLDDVVRIADDQRRPSGRIEDEHPR
jgi:hypothetical protein